MTDRVTSAVGSWPSRVAAGRRRLAWAAIGPAFVASVAYIDPGNFATNFAAGAQSGYRLLWVVAAASLAAMPLQYLSAKLGIVTGRSLPELCRDRLPRRATLGLWFQAELVAMATDVAEFIGGVIGMELLFGMPAPLALASVATLAFGISSLQSLGHRPLESTTIGFLAIVLVGLAYDLLASRPDVHAASLGFVPGGLGGSSGGNSAQLAVGIVGATIMPHAIYLHSGLTSHRRSAAGVMPAQVLRTARLDVGLALGLGSILNLSMLAISASVFGSHRSSAPTLTDIHSQLGTTLGGVAALAFAAALFASGIASSGIGTLAGQTVLEGFLGVSAPQTVRRAVTMIPAVLILACGVNTTNALIFSQVVLSFGVPFAVIPLIALTSNRRLMGRYANGWLMTCCTGGLAAAVIALNLFLLEQVFRSV